MHPARTESIDRRGERLMNHSKQLIILRFRHQFRTPNRFSRGGGGIRKCAVCRLDSNKIGERDQFTLEGAEVCRIRRGAKQGDGLTKDPDCSLELVGRSELLGKFVEQHPKTPSVLGIGRIQASCLDDGFLNFLTRFSIPTELG